MHQIKFGRHLLLLAFELTASGCVTREGDAPPDTDAAGADTDTAPAPAPFVLLESWAHGSLESPRRFLESTSGRPCTIEPFADGHYCLPVNSVPPTIGYVEDACTTLAMIANEQYRAGDLVTYRGWGASRGQAVAVFKIGAPIEYGHVYHSREECNRGRDGLNSALGYRWTLEPVKKSGLVRFEMESVEATADLVVDVYRGEDGSEWVSGVRHGEQECWLVGDRCLSGGAFVWPFQLAFTDDSCTERAWFPDGECVAEGQVMVATDECGEQFVLGTSGPEATTAAYRAGPSGECVAATWGFSPPVEEAGAGRFSTCLQQAVPLSEGVAPQLVETRTTEDGLELVQLSAGALVVESTFRLPDGARCEPVRAADQTLRCAPLEPAWTARTPFGAARQYESDGACNGEPPHFQELYTFAAGHPCMPASVQLVDGADGIPDVTQVDLFVPLDGPVFHTAFDPRGFNACEELSSEGWFTTVKGDADVFPALALVVK